MTDVTEIQNRLEKIACPICKKYGYAIHPRGNHSYMETFYTARCTHCHYSFQVTTPTRPVHQTDPDTAQWLARLVCPSCENQGGELNFRCMLSVRECLYFVTCRACQHPFSEKAPMEVFE